MMGITTTTNTCANKNISASRLARLAAKLLDDTLRPERHDAGAMILFGLAALAGKKQQQHPADVTAVSLKDEALLSATTTARSGALETLRHAVGLVRAASAPLSEMISPAATLSVATAAPIAAPTAAVLSTISLGRDDRLGGGEYKNQGEGENGTRARGRGGERGRRGQKGGVEGWVLHTLDPIILQQHTGNSNVIEELGDRGATAATAFDRLTPPSPALNSTTLSGGMTEDNLPINRIRTRKLSKSESKMLPAELRAHELSAALGLIDALVKAARNSPHPPHPPHPHSAVKNVVASAGVGIGVGGGRWCSSGLGPGPLASLLLETPLAAGLLSLACRDPSAAAAVAAAAAAGDAALAIAREAAAVCPEGMWVGLRAELLPALLSAGSSSHVDSDGNGGKGGGKGATRSRAEGVRAGIVLREVVEGMGTRVVPFAARLLPVALRGMTDADEQVTSGTGISFY